MTLRSCQMAWRHIVSTARTRKTAETMYSSSWFVLVEKKSRQPHLELQHLGNICAASKQTKPVRRNQNFKWNVRPKSWRNVILGRVAWTFLPPSSSRFLRNFQATLSKTYKASSESRPALAYGWRALMWDNGWMSQSSSTERVCSTNDSPADWRALVSIDGFRTGGVMPVSPHSEPAKSKQINVILCSRKG